MKRNSLLTGAVILGLCAAGVIYKMNRSNSSSVSIQKSNGYYDVKVDLRKASHKDVGRDLALAINAAMPDFQSTINESLKTQMGFMEPAGLKFDELLSRARSILPNLDAEYQAEIAGMQSVFNSEIDDLNDGKLSKNELLVYLLGADVMRVFSCSASAAVGKGSATGMPILSRNADALTDVKSTFGKMHAITTYTYGDKSITTIGTLGFLGAISAFNQGKIFGAILDSNTGAKYPVDLANVRSYPFDLRHAFEHENQLEDIANYMRSSNHRYAYNHLVFLGNQATAGVVENEVNPLPGSAPGNRSFRADASKLNPKLPAAQTWGIIGGVAVVNDFRLPGNDFSNTQDNTGRWIAFRSLYEPVKKGNPISAEGMKQIAGYAGPKGDGIMDNGAIFVSEKSDSVAVPSHDAKRETSASRPPAYTTMQSIIVDTSKMDIWVYFADASSNLPRTPTYQKIQLPN